ncbi:hypothetical protein C5167_037393 [Papaver somniferum]|uniref:Uncharacterized protein n=1 Tax=Papaver somniferum TaxID=3469 RepID=A0A4Y7IAB4_PAPSO|nr:solanesyl-diphosphate synthase 1, mitochondrial-like [Papaver somniferum]RZC44448.1 hypothetical protein C5167_037393 [Papaver somniferum]
MAEGREFDFSPLMQLIAAKNVKKQIPAEPHWVFCYSNLQKDSPMIDFAVHLCLSPELRDTFCVSHLVLRALDTVEDDMNIASDIKVAILENFHHHIYDSNLNLSCGTKKHHKDLMDQYHHVSTALSELQEGCQELIVETAKRMGAGMAKFILKEVETVDDYTEYCHIVNGIVWVEMSKYFHASNLKEVAPPDCLADSLGLMTQKQHIIQDFMEDMNKIPKAPMHWPRQIWSKYVDKLGDLASEENSEKAVFCLNDMVTDALSHAQSCLEYLSALQDPAILRFCAIPQIISIGTLALCYNNIEVFRGGVKIRHVIRLCAKVIDELKSMSDVYGACYDILSTLKTKIDNNDPNATKTLSLVEAIQNVCENSGLLNQRGAYSEMGLEGKRDQTQQGRRFLVEGQVDPFSLVADELCLIGNRLRDMVVAHEVPRLSLAAEYFFEMGVEGKRFRPTILLLMASALNVSLPGSIPDAATNAFSGLRTRQQRLAEITEMIHVASLLHDDVLDDANTRRGVPSLNSCMGNKLSVLAGDFLLSRAVVTLASLQNNEVVTLLSTVLEHLVTGEIMQMSGTSEQRCSMDQYMKKTFYKTASLIANSCKAIAFLADQETEVAMLAYDYGRNLGLAFQLIDDILDFTGTSASLGKGSLSDIRHGIITAPILFAIEEFPQLQEVINRGFDNPANVDLALDYLGRSCGIQRATELATEHANLAASAIDALPQSEDDNVRISRRALVELTRIVITRTK